MDPATGAIIGGGISAIGGLLGNKLSSKEANKTRNWQERMQNTYFQRQVKDLRLAGLNPILGYSKGGGSSQTPSGATAQQRNPLEGITSSAKELSLLTANINNINQQTETNKALEAKYIKEAMASSAKAEISDIGAQAVRFVKEKLGFGGEVPKYLERTPEVKKHQKVKAKERAKKVKKTFKDVNKHLEYVPRTTPWSIRN